jgi:hypothetical protein
MSEKWKAGDRVTTRGRPLVVVSNYDPSPAYWRCRTPDGAIILVHEDQLVPAPDLPAPERHHDGQANTSGIERHHQTARLLEHLDRTCPPVKPQPSLLTVLEGVHRWQQADPAHRRAHVSLSGHTATVHVTTLPDLGARRVKFCSAYSAEEVAHILDDLALVGAAHPDMEFKMARNDFRFREDTGEIG